MPKVKISEYSSTANSNTDVASINIDEGCAPSGINNAIRAVMGHLKDFQTGSASDPLTVGGALTTSSTVTHNGGTANGVAYLNGSKVLTTGSALTFDGTSLFVQSGGTNAKLDAFTAAQRYIDFTWYGSSIGSISQVDGTYIAVNSSNLLPFSISGSEQMRLTSTGLGIGTSSPGAKLTVAGEVRSTTVDGFRINNGTELGAFKYSGGLVIDRVAGTSLFLTSAGNNQATLDSSGNLGLGVTPSAWTTLKPIQFAGGASLAGFSNTGYLNANAYFDGSWRYIATASSGRYEVAADHKWYSAASGTAGNAISFTQAMTLDASGYLLVGATSSDGVGANRFQVGQSGGQAQLLAKTSTGHANIYATGTDVYQTWVSGGFLAFGQGPSNGSSFTERARIDSSGNLLVGTTSLLSTSRGAFHAAVNGNAAEFKVATNGYGLVFFSAASAFVGSVVINSAGVAYNTSSDYRLKENIAPMTGALAKVAALKPVTYTWKADGSAGEGFIAHELAEVCPAAVTGEKDAVDADGKPQYQGIDVSFLVGTLTAAIKEQQAIIEDMKTRLLALESK